MPPPRRSSSAEQLQQRVTLVGAPAWILTLIIVGVVAAALGWSIFGTVLIKVNGRGLLVYEGNQYIPVPAPEEATITAIHVAVGDTVQPGQLLLELNQPSLDLELELARNRLEELQKVLGEVSSSAADFAANQERVNEEQERALAGQQAQMQEQVQFYSSHVDDLLRLMHRGATTPSVVEAAREKLGEARFQLVQIETTRTRVKSEFLEAKFNWRQRLTDARLAAEQQQSLLSNLEERQGKLSRIVAKRTGYVSEISVTLGQVVAPGNRVLTLGTQTSGYEVIAFFRPFEGKLVFAGMQADVVPTTVRREEYGPIEGQVRSVSTGPISHQEAVKVLGSEAVATFLAGNEPPILAHIAIVTQPDDGERMVWRNGAGPPYPVTRGTVTNAQVIVLAQAPITLVFPYLKSLFGL